MYTKWLYFFNSPLRETNVKGKKTKQTVKKEWLDEGSMKISGELPTEWSVTLQPILSTDIYTLKYEVKNDKIEARDLFKRAFKYRNKTLFSEGESIYKNSEKKQKEINELLSNNDKLLKTVQEKIFQIRRKLYFVGLEKNVNFNKVKKLTAELEKITLEQINIQKNIKEQENNYILRTQSVIQKGPIPEPPTVKHLSLKIGRKKLQFEKDIEEEEKRAEQEKQNEESENDSENDSGDADSPNNLNDSNDPDEDVNILNEIINENINTPENVNTKISNEEKINENKKGGYIKIIKLS